MADNDTVETTDTAPKGEMLTGNDAPDGADQEAVRAELEETRKALKKANSEAAARRKQLEEYEEAERKRKEAELSEVEKLTNRVSEMEARAQEAEARLDLLHKQRAFFAATEAANLQFANEKARQLAVSSLDLSEMDEDDMAAAVKEMQKDMAFLFTEAKLPDIDGAKRGKQTKAGAEEEAIKAAAQRWGIRYIPKD